MKLWITNGNVSKEGYARKNEWAAERNATSKDIGISNGLTEEQCDTLATVARERHFIHTHQDSFFNSESADNRKMNRLLAGESEDSIHQILQDVGLANNLSWDIETIPCDYDVYELGEDYDETYNACMDELENINTQIEQYLKSIDEQYGTSYCPTGYTRM